MRRLLLSLLGWFLMTGPVEADNWPHWRGPLATGISPERNLPERWNTGENIAWRTRLRGLGISTPIVWGDRLIVTSQMGAGTSRPGPRLVQNQDAAAAGEVPLGARRGRVAEDPARVKPRPTEAAPPAEAGDPTRVLFLVTALDRDSGRRLWEYELAAEGRLPPVHEKHNLATASPVTDGERVYAWFGTGQLVALDLDGTLVWRRHLGAEYGPFEINWGHGSSPVVYKDTVILLCYHETSSYLLALDARTGRTRWKRDRLQRAFSYSTPLVVPAPGGPELVVNHSEGVEAFNPENGERLWYLAEANRFPIPMALHHDGRIYLSRGYRSGPYLAIRPGGRGDISKTHVEWRVDAGAPYISSLVHYDGLLYMAGDVGVITCVDAATGARVWQERMGGVYTASPVAGDGKIYLASESGDVMVLRAGRTPEILARNTLDARLLASPVISQGRLFLRSDDEVIAIGK